MEGKSVKGKSIQNSSIKNSSIKDIKSKGLSFVIAVLLGIFGVAGAVLVVSRFFAASQDATVAEEQATRAQVANPSIEVAEPKALQQPTLPGSKNGLVADAANAISTKAEEKAIATRQGGLRIGNLSDHPIRVALLIKKPNSAKDTSAKDPATTDADQTAYEPPAHWDFDPGEGSTKGLIVSLPNRKIKLKKGDVLVAFAQDGSRQYWGPYVVGETSTPVWSPKTAEWELILQP